MSAIEYRYKDYTLEELEAYDKMARETKPRVKSWGTQRGDRTYRIPYEHIKIHHAKNIVKWIKAHYDKFGPKILTEMETLYRKKLEELPNGKLLYGSDD